MFLSRIELDLNKRDTIKAMASPAIFHGAIEASFPGAKKRRLWRMENLHGKRYVLILSEDIPMLEDFAKQFGTAGAYETRNYDGLLDRISNGSTWRFRLVANPTYAERESGKRGKVKAHRTEEHQREWLMRKAEQCGFSLSNDDFFVNGSEFLKFKKRDHGNTRTVNMIAVTYDGVLHVTDSEKFKNALCEGIGREKAYGMGLLTVIKNG